MNRDTNNRKLLLEVRRRATAALLLLQFAHGDESDLDKKIEPNIRLDEDATASAAILVYEILDLVRDVLE